MVIPEELRYTRDNLWVKEENGLYVIGITDYAQDLLGEVTSVGITAGVSAAKGVGKGECLATVESLKSVSDIMSPFAGTVVLINEALQGSPGQVNTDPYGEGWLLKLSDVDRGDFAVLLSADDYATLLNE